MLYNISTQFRYAVSEDCKHRLQKVQHVVKAIKHEQNNNAGGAYDPMELSGASSELQFNNGIRDRGRQNMHLIDFRLNQPTITFPSGAVVPCGLNDAHVLALRLYTTKVFRLINNPFRPPPQVLLQGVQPPPPPPRPPPHPMPATVLFLQEN